MLGAVSLAEIRRPQIEIEQQPLVPEVLRPGQALCQQFDPILSRAESRLHPQQRARPAQVRGPLDGLDEHGGGIALGGVQIPAVQGVLRQDGKKRPRLLTAVFALLQQFHRNVNGLVLPAQGQHKSCRQPGLAHLAVGGVIPGSRLEAAEVVRQSPQVPGHGRHLSRIGLPQALAHAVGPHLPPELHEQGVTLLQWDLRQVTGQVAGQTRDIDRQHRL